MKEASVVTIGPEDGCIIIRADGTREILIPHDDDGSEPVGPVALSIFYMSILGKYPDVMAQLEASVHKTIESLEGDKEESDGEDPGK